MCGFWRRIFHVHHWKVIRYGVGLADIRAGCKICGEVRYVTGFDARQKIGQVGKIVEDELRHVLCSHGFPYGYFCRECWYPEEKGTPDGQICVHGVHVRSECPECEREVNRFHGSE